MLFSRCSSRHAVLVSALLLALSTTANAAAGAGDEVQYDDSAHGTVTLDGANGTQLKNVAEGTDPTDAVNLNQMEAGDMMAIAAARKSADVGDDRTLASANSHAAAGDAATLGAAKAYADTRFAAWNDSFNQYRQQLDQRFAHTDRRIDRTGAMGTAMTHMAVNAANGTGAKGRLAVGVGAQGGEGAVSIGYGKRIGGRGSFSLGAAFGKGEQAAGAGFGFDL